VERFVRQCGVSVPEAETIIKKQISERFLPLLRVDEPPLFVNLITFKLEQNGQLGTSNLLGLPLND